MYPSHQQTGPPQKRSLRTHAIAVIAALSIVLVTPNGAFAQTASSPASDIEVSILDENGNPYAPTEMGGELQWVPADQADTDAARGCVVWVVAVLAGHVVIRLCLRNARTCMSTVQGAVQTFDQNSAARRWVCRRYGRLC